MLKIIAVFAGGGLGAAARYGVSSVLNRISGPAFPLGTLGVNVLGSFLIGLLIPLFQETVRIPPEGKVLLLVGFLGAFTTFSTYSLETVQLFKSQAYLKGMANFLLNNSLCILAVLGGNLLVRGFRI